MQLDQGVAALLGALVGGAVSLLVVWLTLRHANQQAERLDKEMNRAAAILLQDDFYHYQATLAHAIDDSCWWNSAQLLPDEASGKDVKRVYAALLDADANNVAGARGWMRVLIQRHSQVTLGTPLGPADLEIVRETFRRLERGRSSLASLASRKYIRFGSPLVMNTLKKQTVEEVRLLSEISSSQP